ncbi:MULTISPECIES: NAD(+) diphosphatase [Thermocrispum]|uniref:NAD(+) diphosphatase n=1 Tax=Thermocrispum agreste TaxID=37925 RepID=A0A2W4J9B8_9PSEU|nr:MULTISPECIES: NAD(+) diphosphatase [Thermocrispum]PZM95720.1 MAG: NAD(+) diphosphatase [Thermocrispum agreste]
MTAGSTEPFRLHSVPALARVTVDRSEWLRQDRDALREGWPTARVLVLDKRGRTPVLEDDGRLALRKAMDIAPEPPEGAIFLGRSPEADYWAVLDVPEPEGQVVEVPGRFGVAVTHILADGERWVGLREYGDDLDDTGAGLFTTALALRSWYRRAAHCARCGAATEIVHAGWASRCTGCGREEYPRTDPAVICLVHDDVGVNGERVLLARGAGWPAGARSVLAGFVEAGESLEACVVREIREEVGITVRDVRYLGSQPWPFPRSIMLGFAARADRDAPLKLAEGEIETARWFTRDEIRDAFARADRPPKEGDAELRLPTNSSIARLMLESWAAAEP